MRVGQPQNCPIDVDHIPNSAHHANHCIAGFSLPSSPLPPAQVITSKLLASVSKRQTHDKN